MAKKAQYYQAAEQLYVFEHLGLADIAARIPVSERTLGDWSREGNWDEKRQNHMQQQTTTTEKLHKVVDKMAEKIIEKLDQNEDPSQSQLYLLGKLSPILVRMQKFEESVQKPAEEGVTEETLAEQKQMIQEFKETLMRLGLV